MVLALAAFDRVEGASAHGVLNIDEGLWPLWHLLGARGFGSETSVWSPLPSIPHFRPLPYLHLLPHTMHPHSPPFSTAHRARETLALATFNRVWGGASTLVVFNGGERLLPVWHLMGCEVASAFVALFSLVRS